MSYRNFGKIKALFHFDYPYIFEPGDGLLDDVSGSHSFFIREGNTKFAGAETAELISTKAPKFGYRCPYFSGANDFISSSDFILLNLIKAKNCVIDFFILVEAGASGSILKLLNNNNSSILSLNINENSLTLSNSTNNLNINSELWQHLTFIFNSSTLTVKLNNSSSISASLGDLTGITKISLGGFKGFIDELAFHEGIEFSGVPTEPYNATLDVNKIGSFGNALLGDVNISANAYINSYGLISGANSSKLEITSWFTGKFGNPKVGDEILIHVTKAKFSAHDLTGLYAFRRINSISGNTYTLDLPITEFDIYNAVNNYYVQAIKVAEFKNLNIISGVTVSAYSYGANFYGGIIALRASENINLQGSIISMGSGPQRTDLIQMSHSQLIDRFMINSGGGIFIACGGTISASNTARIGATWDGANSGGDNSNPNGGAGYGGAGGRYSTKIYSGMGGVGGGGGAHHCTHTHKVYDSGNAGKDGKTGGYGYVHYAKKSERYGGTQGVDDGAMGPHIHSGGGALGNGGGINSGCSKSGASVILIANTLNVDASALSTGGEGCLHTKDVNKIHGGGGSGLCYIACNSMT